MLTDGNWEFHWPTSPVFSEQHFPNGKSLSSAAAVRVFTGTIWMRIFRFPLFFWVWEIEPGKHRNQSASDSFVDQHSYLTVLCFL